MTGADDVSRPLAVQKFGGTSVATAEGRAAVVARVRAKIAQGSDVIVVVAGNPARVIKTGITWTIARTKKIALPEAGSQ